MTEKQLEKELVELKDKISLMERRITELTNAADPQELSNEHLLHFILPCKGLEAYRAALKERNKQREAKKRLADVVSYAE